MVATGDCCIHPCISRSSKCFCCFSPVEVCALWVLKTKCVFRKSLRDLEPHGFVTLRTVLRVVSIRIPSSPTCDILTLPRSHETHRPRTGASSHPSSHVFLWFFPVFTPNKPCCIFLGAGARSTLWGISCSHLAKQTEPGPGAHPECAFPLMLGWQSGLQMHESCINRGRLLTDCPWPHVRCGKRPPAAGGKTPAWLMLTV